MILWHPVYGLSEPDFWICFWESYHGSSNFAECRYFTKFKGHISVLRTAAVMWSGMLVVLHVLCMQIWPWPDPRSRSLIFCSSKNCTFLRLLPPLFCGGAHNWWVITVVWDQVYSCSEPDFWISPPIGGHVTSKFAKFWYHENSLHFISMLAEARSLWLWLQVGRKKPCMLAAMAVSPLAGLFCV